MCESCWSKRVIVPVMNIEDLQKRFPPEINLKLKYVEDTQNSVIRIMPADFLGSERFAAVCRVVRDTGGVYVSAGKDSHFEVPYTPPTEQDMRERAEKMELAGRYEEAAKIYETLGMYKEAGAARRMGRTQYVISAIIHIGKDGTISINCPHCGASQPVESKSGEVTCKYCGKGYIIPRNILDQI